MEKTFNNIDPVNAKENVKDIEFWGDSQTFVLISKASSKEEGWMKSTKAMQTGNSVVLQVTTQQRNPDGSYVIAEALTTIPLSRIREFKNDEGVVISRKVVYIHSIID